MLLILLSVGVFLLSLGSGGQGSGGGGGGGSGAQPEAKQQPQPLLMLMSSRSGSSLMTEALNLHPRILFTSELFNAKGDWLGANPRAAKYFSGNYVAVYERYRNQSIQYTVPAKAYDQLQAVGFKLRPLEAGVLPGSAGWRALERVRPKIICSHRRSQVKGTLSHLRALELTTRCGTPNVIQRVNCSLPANWVPSPDGFKELLVLRMAEAQQFIDLCQQAAESFHTLFVAYEDLLADRAGTIERILRFVGMPAANAEPFMAKLRSNSLPIGIEKNTPDDLAELLAPGSLRELRAAAEQVYASEAATLFL